jgi:hypothetical protein
MGTRNIRRRLQSAKPRLLTVVEKGDATKDGGQQMLLSPYISDVHLGWDELINEGFDPDGKTGLGPVYWRVVERANERFYLSTHFADRRAVLKVWGQAGLVHCDHDGIAVARVETRLPAQHEGKENGRL